VFTSCCPCISLALRQNPFNFSLADRRASLFFFYQVLYAPLSCLSFSPRVVFLSGSGSDDASRFKYIPWRPLIFPHPLALVTTLIGPGWSQVRFTTPCGPCLRIVAGSSPPTASAMRFALPCRTIVTVSLSFFFFPGCRRRLFFFSPDLPDPPRASLVDFFVNCGANLFDRDDHIFVPRPHNNRRRSFLSPPPPPDREQ